MGYKRETIVTKTGEMAVRGFIIDIFPINYNNPIRIEFWGDQIDRISEFDIDTQTSTNRLTDIEILPVTEFIVNQNVEEDKYRDISKYIKPDSIIDYLIDPEIVYNEIKLPLLKFEG